MGGKRKVIIPLLITLVLLLVFVAAWAGISRNDYVFKINGQKISMNEFSPYLTLQKKSMELELGENVWDMLIKDAPAIETARDAAKESLVDTVVKVQEAKKRKISLSKEEIEEITTYATSLEEQLTEYGITVEEFIKINEDVALIEKLPLALYKEQDHSTHTHGKIDVESFELGKESSLGVTTFNSRHILFSTKDLTETEEAAVKTKAQGVLDRILAGEDFATLANEYTEDPGSKGKGGLYENIERGSFVPEYEDAVFSIKSGEVYPELVKSAHGYHIIKSEGITNPDGVLSLGMAQNVILTEFTEQAQEWVDNAKVDINKQRYNAAQ